MKRKEKNEPRGKAKDNAMQQGSGVSSAMARRLRLKRHGTLCGLAHSSGGSGRKSLSFLGALAVIRKAAPLPDKNTPATLISMLVDIRRHSNTKD